MTRGIPYSKAIFVARRQAIKAVGGMKKWNKMSRFSRDQFEGTYLEDIKISKYD